MKYICLFLSCLCAANCFAAERISVFINGGIIAGSENPIVMHVYLYARNISDDAVNVVTGPATTTDCMSRELVPFRVTTQRMPNGELLKPRPADLNIVTLNRGELVLIQTMILHIYDLRDFPKAIIYDVDQSIKIFYDVWTGKMRVPVTQPLPKNKVNPISQP